MRRGVRVHELVLNQRPQVQNHVFPRAYRGVWEFEHRGIGSAAPVNEHPEPVQIARRQRSQLDELHPARVRGL